MLGDDNVLVPRIIQNRSYLGDMFDNFMFPSDRVNSICSMKCDIYEKDSVYYLEMDIPGFDKEDINIEINDNDYVTITALKSDEKISEDDNKNYIHRERSYCKNIRSFYVGGIDKERIEANFVNGTLKVSMPKKEEVKSSTKTIEIK